MGFGYLERRVDFLHEIIRQQSREIQDLKTMLVVANPVAAPDADSVATTIRRKRLWTKTKLEQNVEVATWRRRKRLRTKTKGEQKRKFPAKVLKKQLVQGQQTQRKTPILIDF